MRIFGADRIQDMMGRLGMEEGEPIEHGMVSRAIERAQKQVEGRNFETRKHLLEYDDVMNKQREAIYGLRREILARRAGKDYILGLAETIVDYVVGPHCPRTRAPTEWNLAGGDTDLLAYFDLEVRDRSAYAGKTRRRDPRGDLARLAPEVRGEGGASSAPS